MKRLLIIFAILLASVFAHSQILISILLGDKLNSDKLEFGIEGGLNMSDINGIAQSNSANRFNIGFYLDFKLKNPNWMVHTGIIGKSTMGARGIPVYSLNNADLDNSFAGGSIDRRLSYFNLPVLMKYRFENNFSVEAGPMFGLMNKAVDKFTRTVVNKDDLTYENKLKIKDQFHFLDAGLMFGLGYRLLGGNGINLGIRYYMGLVDITKDNATPNQYNRTLYFSVGIPVGKAK